MTARTQAEIVSRMHDVAADDFLGFRRDVLLGYLDFEHAREFVKPETTAEQWLESLAGARTAEVEGADYLAFAIGKAEDHRGISASRSVDKLTEYAWLAGRDDIVRAMDDADYAQYGVPKLKAFADGFGLPWPDSEMLARMAQGRPCDDDCQSGCGL